MQEKVVVIDRWSLKQGSLNSGRFFEALSNSGDRHGTHAYNQRNNKSRRPGASGGLVWWFSRKVHGVFFLCFSLHGWEKNQWGSEIKYTKLKKVTSKAQTNYGNFPYNTSSIALPLYCVTHMNARTHAHTHTHVLNHQTKRHVIWRLTNAPVWGQLLLINIEKNMKKATLSSAYLHHYLEQGKGPAQLHNCSFCMQPKAKEKRKPPSAWRTVPHMAQTHSYAGRSINFCFFLVVFSF